MISTVFNVNVYPHPSKRKNGIKTEEEIIDGYGQDAANTVDKKYRDKGNRIRKVLVGFYIDGRFVPSELERQN